MKLPTKYIAILVITSLTAIFAYQAHWLFNMYDTTKVKNRTTIRHAIRNADYLELFMRVDSISELEEKEGKLSSQANGKGEFSFSASFNRNNDEENHENVFKKRVKKNDSIFIEKEEKFNPKDIGLPNDFNLKDGYHALEFLAFQVQSGLHSVIDSNAAPINLSRFDSILTADLRNSGLGIPHYTRIVKLENDSTLATSLTSKIDTTKLERFEHIYDAQQKYAFHIFMERTDKITLMQMTGILITSLIILIVLAGSFWFLIRTIMKQKTLDEMKSDFTNNITHELKTPIAVAYAVNDALLNFNLSEDKELRNKYLRISQEQLEKLSGLVEQILSMSMERRKTFHLNMEEVQVDSIIHSLIEQHKLKAEKPVYFDIKVTPRNMMITTDRTHFSNMISNLVDNAVKYSQGEGWVTIHCQSKNGRTEISVQDKGMGISAEKQKYIFDKFYRVPTGNLHHVKGYGLGLYYVKTMAEKLGGQVDVKSESGKGSIFTIVFEGTV